jgi:metallophosphoesterase (TIGR00282 family)
MKILMLGDVNGSPGRRMLKEHLKRLRSELNLSAVVVNAENAAAGNGITAPLAREIFEAGADAITMGDHTWWQRELAGTIGQIENFVRPANGGAGQPGKGWTVVSTPQCRFAVLNLLGRVFMGQADCPFRTADACLKEMPKDVPVLVDFHAEATSEKNSLAHYLDGRVAALAGTHTHVQTSDAIVLPKGTAYITDLGMCGPYLSSIGRDVDAVVKKFITGMPARFQIAEGPATLEGAVVEIDPATKLAVSIEPVRVREPYRQG